MATFTWYVLSTGVGLAATPNWWSILQENGSAPTAATTAYGWAPAKTATTTPYYQPRLGASAASGTAAQASSYNASTTGPTKGTNNTSTTAGDCFVTPNPYNGTFASGAWTFAWNLRASTAGCVGHVNMRVWAATTADGITGKRELTSSNLAGATVTLSTSADVNSSISWTPGSTVTLVNEYLFFQIEWQETTQGTSNGDNVFFRANTTLITSTNFLKANQKPVAVTQAEVINILKSPIKKSVLPILFGQVYAGPGNVVSGAMAWWGLRAYSAATAGNVCVQLRRDSDNATKDFFTIPVAGILDVGAIAAWAGAANLFVSKLYDQSGNSRDLSQTTAAQQPSFLLSGFGGVTRPVIAGGNTWLTGPVFPSTAIPISMSFVYQVTANARVNIAGWNAAGNQIIPDYPSVGLLTAYPGLSATATESTWHVAQIIWNVASSSINLDGVQTTGTTSSGFFDGTNIFYFLSDITSDNFPGGYLPEFGIWPLGFNSTQISNMNSNQTTYWISGAGAGGSAPAVKLLAGKPPKQKALTVALSSLLTLIKQYAPKLANNKIFTILQGQNTPLFQLMGTGNFQTIQISSIIDPMTLVPLAWYKADAGITLTGSTVSQWNDQSGNGFHFKQPSGSSQPNFLATGLNGLPTLQFVPTNLSVSMATDTVAIIGGNVVSVFAIAQLVTSGGTYGRILSYLASGATNDFDNIASAPLLVQNNNLAQMEGFRNNVALSQVNISFGQNYRLASVWDGVNETTYVNNVPGTPAASTGTFGTTGIFSLGTGGGGYWNGLISEIIVFNRVLTTTEQANLDNYLAIKWGLGGVTGGTVLLVNLFEQIAHKFSLIISQATVFSKIIAVRRIATILQNANMSLIKSIKKILSFALLQAIILLYRPAHSFSMSISQSIKFSKIIAVQRLISLGQNTSLSIIKSILKLFSILYTQVISLLKTIAHKFSIINPQTAILSKFKALQRNITITLAETVRLITQYVARSGIVNQLILTISGGGPSNLLLHFDGPDGSTTFTDSSSLHNTVNGFGHAKISTTQNEFGGSSASFDGTDSYLSVPNGSVFNIPGDFTLDVWIYPTASVDQQQVYGIYEPTVTQASIAIRQSGSGDTVGFGYWIGFASSSTSISNDILAGASLGTVDLNTWQHLAITRVGNNYYLFKNGILISTAASSLSPYTTTAPLVIGAHILTGPPIDRFFNGYQDEFHFINGTGLWTSNFTPPTAPYTLPSFLINLVMRRYLQKILKIPGSISNLLLHFDGVNGSTSFPDSSAYNNTVTVNGATQVSTTQSKFGGASVYFDGSTSYLTIPDDGIKFSPQGDFTIDFWVYSIAFVDLQEVFSKFTTATGLASGGPYGIRQGLTNQWTFFASSDPSLNGDITTNGGNIIIAFGTVIPGQWQHIAIVRSGNQYFCFLDGILGTTINSSLAPYASSDYLAFGARYYTNIPDRFFNGYVDEFNFRNGYAAWISNFTPPTAPYSPPLTVNLITQYIARSGVATQKALSLVQNQAINLIRAIRKILVFGGNITNVLVKQPRKLISFIQTQITTLLWQIAHKFSMTVSQTAILSKIIAVQRLISITQNTSLSLIKTIKKFISVAFTQIINLNRTISKSMTFFISEIIGLIPTYVKGVGQVTQKALTVLHGQIINLSRSTSKILAFTQNQIINITRAMSKMMTSSNPENVRLIKQPQKLLVFSLAQVTNLRRTILKLILVVQPQIINIQRAMSKFIGITLAQILTATLAATHIIQKIITILQPLSVIAVANKYTGILTQKAITAITQAQVVALKGLQGKYFTNLLTQSINLAKNISKTLSFGQAQVIIIYKTIKKLILSLQPQLVGLIKSKAAGKILTLAQTQIMNFRRAMNKVLSFGQNQAIAFTRAISKTLILAQTQLLHSQNAIQKFIIILQTQLANLTASKYTGVLTQKAIAALSISMTIILNRSLLRAKFISFVQTQTINITRAIPYFITVIWTQLVDTTNVIGHRITAMTMGQNISLLHIKAKIQSLTLAMPETIRLIKQTQKLIALIQNQIVAVLYHMVHVFNLNVILSPVINLSRIIGKGPFLGIFQTINIKVESAKNKIISAISQSQIVNVLRTLTKGWSLQLITTMSQNVIMSNLKHLSVFVKVRIGNILSLVTDRFKHIITEIADVKTKYSQVSTDMFAKAKRGVAIIRAKFRPFE